jgi:hypothetical protein
MRSFVKFSTVFLSLVLIYSATWFVTQKFAPPEQLKPRTMIDYTPLGSIKDFPEERMAIEKNFHNETKNLTFNSTEGGKESSNKVKSQQAGKKVKRQEVHKDLTVTRPITNIVSSGRSQPNMFDSDDPISMYLHGK